MSDPSVYNDHREAADAGRRLKELEGPYRLAQEWRETEDDLEAARGDAELRGLVGALARRLGEAEGGRRAAEAGRRPRAPPRGARGGAPARARRARPGRLEGRHPRGAAGRRR